MKSAISFIVLVAGLTDAWTPGLRVRFGTSGDLGVDYFMDLPKSLAQAEAAAWQLTSRPDGPFSFLTMYCFPDRVVCVVFDDTDYIAGLQISIPVDQWSGNVHHMEDIGFTLWTPSVPEWEEVKSYWTLPQYFVNADFLSLPKSQRMAARAANPIIQNGAVWVTGVGKELVRVGSTTVELDNSIFTKQACIPWMGSEMHLPVRERSFRENENENLYSVSRPFRHFYMSESTSASQEETTVEKKRRKKLNSQHYYYNMSSTTDCSIPLFPWFPMVNGDQLIATGFMVLGQLDKPQIARTWFENPLTAEVQAIVPYGPDCLFEQTDNPGVLTMHVYYVEEPWTIFC